MAINDIYHNSSLKDGFVCASILRSLSVIVLLSNSELCQRGRQLLILGVLVVIFDVHLDNEKRSQRGKSRQRGRGNEVARMKSRK